jgi:hypothetical protein
MASAFTFLIPALAVFGPVRLDVPIPLAAIPVASMLITLWMWARLPFTGAFPRETSVLVRSWFSRRIFQKSEVARFRHVQYSGLFFFTAWASDVGWLAHGMVELETTDGSRIPLRATICGLRDARLLSEALNRWAGSEVGTGTGTRRQPPTPLA